MDAWIPNTDIQATSYIGCVIGLGLDLMAVQSFSSLKLVRSWAQVHTRYMVAH